MFGFVDQLILKDNNTAESPRAIQKVRRTLLVQYERGLLDEEELQGAMAMLQELDIHNYLDWSIDSDKYEVLDDDEIDLEYQFITRQARGLKEN